MRRTPARTSSRVMSRSCPTSVAASSPVVPMKGPPPFARARARRARQRARWHSMQAVLGAVAAHHAGHALVAVGERRRHQRARLRRHALRHARGDVRVDAERHVRPVLRRKGNARVSLLVASPGALPPRRARLLGGAHGDDHRHAGGHAARELVPARLLHEDGLVQAQAARRAAAIGRRGARAAERQQPQKRQATHDRGRSARFGAFAPSQAKPSAPSRTRRSVPRRWLYARASPSLARQRGRAAWRRRRLPACRAAGLQLAPRCSQGARRHACRRCSRTSSCCCWPPPQFFGSASGFGSSSSRSFRATRRRTC